MTTQNWPTRKAGRPRRKAILPVAGLLAVLCTYGAIAPATWAQEAGTEGGANPLAAENTAAEAGLLDPDALDTLFAPVALYPDALLAQILLSATYPIDVVKADLFLQKNTGKTPEEMSELIASQDWPEPVKGLAAGFPDLIGRMVEHVDWTEMAGNALISQTDDCLASIQRLRAQAKLNGYLEDNAAMNVEESDTGNISIASANPEVVYVPQYTETVYTSPAPSTPVYVTDDDDWEDFLVAGAIVWGGATLIDEIFDDDDWDDDWNDYWDDDRPGGGNHIDWEGDINIDNGINIGNGSGNGRPNWGAGDGGLGGAIGGGVAGGIAGGALNRPTTLPAIDSGRLGDVSDDRLRNAKDGNFKPSDASRDAAREKIATRNAAGGNVATLPAATKKGDRVGKPSTPPKAGTTAKRPSGATSPKSSLQDKPKVAKPKSVSRPTAGSAKASKNSSPAFKPSSGSRAKAASSRGKTSRKRSR